MRIRKQQSRGSAGGESSGANPGAGSQEHELVQSARGVKDKPGDEVQMLNSEVVVIEEKGQEEIGRQIIERVDSTSRSVFTWLDKLRYSKGFTEIEPYSNLEDFITSLSKDGGSSSKGRNVSNEEEVVEGSELNRLNAQKLGRYNSVCSELSSKQAGGVGPEGALSPILVSCDDSSMSASFAKGHQLRSDASLPSAFKHCALSGIIPVHDASKKALNLETKHDKQEREGPSSKAIRKGYAGTSSEKPMHDEIRSGTMEGPCTDVARSQLATVEAEFKQGLGSSKAEPGETRFGTLLQIDQLQGPSETARRRSQRKWRISSFTDAERSHVPHEATAPAAPAATTSENLPSAFSQDHPALQPKDGLVFSLYTACLRAGKPGLTAREAVSEILHQELPGLEDHEGAVQSSRRIAKLFRKSPYYMELGEGKFALCSAVTNTSEAPQSQPQPRLQDQPDSGKAPESSTADVTLKRRQKGEEEAQEPESEEKKSRPGRSGRPKKLKYMKQENVGELGNQCNRTDGKGWVCPLLAKPGYQLCDHHLDKLRCKPGSRSKKNKKKSTLAEPPLDTAGHE